MKIIQVVTVPENQIKDALFERFPQLAEVPPLFDGDWNAILAPEKIKVGCSIVAVCRWEEARALDRQMLVEIRVEAQAEVMMLEGLRLIYKSIREMHKSADLGVPPMLGPLYEQMMDAAGTLEQVGQGTDGFDHFNNWCAAHDVKRSDVAPRRAGSPR